MPNAPFFASTAGLRTGSRFGFSSVTRFLQQDVPDPGTQSLRASVLALSALVEQATQVRREHQAIDAIERQAATLSRQARQHQLLLSGLGPAWHVLYEFGAYQQAVQSLRQALERWRAALQQREGAEPQRFQEFERLAWRTLGEALLVLDLYEQQEGAGRPPSAPPRAFAKPARQPLLGRLRTWLGGRRVS